VDFRRLLRKDAKPLEFMARNSIAWRLTFTFRQKWDALIATSSMKSTAPERFRNQQLTKLKYRVKAVT